MSARLVTRAGISCRRGLLSLNSIPAARQQQQTRSATKAAAAVPAGLDPPPITCKTDVDSVLRSGSAGTRQRPASSKPARPRPQKPVDETSIAGALHKPSIGGASLAHLVSELSATTPQMLRDGLRVEGQTADETSRTTIRRTAAWLMGFPVAVGSAWVAWQWYKGDFNSAGGSKTRQQGG